MNAMPPHLDPSLAALPHALAELLDRAAITRVVQDWGLHRDAGCWDELLSHYTPDASMTTTWFVGSASEFVRRSREAAAAGAQAQHFIGAASIELAGDRAVAQTRMQLLLRAPVHGVVVDVVCHGRFHDLFARTEGQWRIRQRVPIYEKDRLDPVLPGQPLALDPARLAALPAGCRHLAYVQTAGGSQLTPDLPCPGNAALARLTAQGAAWLAGKPL